MTAVVVLFEDNGEGEALLTPLCRDVRVEALCLQLAGKYMLAQIFWKIGLVGSLLERWFATRPTTTRAGQRHRCEKKKEAFNISALQSRILDDLLDRTTRIWTEACMTVTDSRQ